MRCPCCGKEVEDKVIRDTDGNTIKDFKQVFCPHCGVNMPMLARKHREAFPVVKIRKDLQKR